MDPNDELEQLRARVAHLESLVEHLADRQHAERREPAPAHDAGLDRRRMLRKGLGLSAAAAAGIGALDAWGSSAAAASGDPLLVGQSVAATAFDSPPTRIFNPSNGILSPLLFHVDNTAGGAPDLLPNDVEAAVAGVCAGPNALGTTKVGLLGVNDDGGAGVQGSSTFGIGVKGISAADVGV